MSEYKFLLNSESKYAPTLSIVESLLLQNLSDDTCLDTLRISRCAGLHIAFNAALRKAATALKRLAKYPIFLLLEEDVVECILDQAAISTDSEETTLESLVVWMNGGFHGARGIALLHKIRFHLINSTCLFKLRQTHGHLWPFIHEALITSCVQDLEQDSQTHTSTVPPIDDEAVTFTDDEQEDVPVVIRALRVASRIARDGSIVCSGATDGSITAWHADRRPLLPTASVPCHHLHCPLLATAASISGDRQCEGQGCVLPACMAGAAGHRPR